MISASAVTTRHELIMSLVAGLNPIMKVRSRTLSPHTQLNNDENSCRDGANFFFLGQHAKISFKFTYKAFVFSDLSVSKTHFTDKQLFLIILSVIAIFRAGQLRTKCPFSSICP